MTTEPAPAATVGEERIDRRRKSWTIASVLAVALLITPLFALVIQLILGHWPGEADFEGDLSTGTFWRARAVELGVVAIMLVAGSLTVRRGFRRLHPRAFHAVLAVAAGVALSIPAAVLITNSADAASAEYLQNASWGQQDSAPAPPPTAPSPELAALLWKPEVPGLPTSYYSGARASTPDECARGLGATESASQAGDLNGVVIVERITTFSSAAQAAAYSAGTEPCGRSDGDANTDILVVLPKIRGVDAQTAWVTTGTPGGPFTHVQMQVGSAVIRGVSGPVTATQATEIASALAQAATD